MNAMNKKDKKDKFLTEYDARSLEDDIMRNSEEVKSFSRKFRNYLKRSLPDCNIVQYSLGHYFVSTFIERDGRYVYLSYSIPRHGQKISVDADAGKEGYVYPGSVLVRAALDGNDYSGGSNHYCSLSTIPRAVEGLLSREEGRG